MARPLPVTLPGVSYSYYACFVCLSSEMAPEVVPISLLYPSALPYVPLNTSANNAVIGIVRTGFCLFVCLFVCLLGLNA